MARKTVAELLVDVLPEAGVERVYVRSQMMFMVNETRGVLSSLFECVHAHADLRTRRTAPLPAQVAAKIDALIDEHRTLNWAAPVSASMGDKVASGA